MKKLLIFCLGAALSCSAFSAAFGQGDISAPVVRRNTLPPVSRGAQSEGSLQRGVRLGNVLQMFNPVAPREYGDGRDFVTARDAGPRTQPRGGAVGLRLFSVAF